MLGNEKAKKVISLFLDRIATSWEVSFPFFLVEADEWVHAFSYLSDQIRQMVWDHRLQDVKILGDHSKMLGKHHSLKVEVKSKDRFVKDEAWDLHEDTWARELIEWLSLAPAGRLKVVLIENLERMTIGAANSLLKSFEEPLPGRVILATSRNTDGLLDTIRSRAFLVRTVAPTHEQIIQNYSWQDMDPWVLSSCVALSGWDQHKLDTLIAWWDENQTITDFTELAWLVTRSQKWFQIVQLVKSLSTDYSDGQLLDALLEEVTSRWSYETAERLMKAKRMIWSNVWAENVWFGLGVQK